MPGLGATLFHLSVGETAVPTDKTYILPGFEVKPTCTETSMGLGSLLASHVFKPRDRDDPFLAPAPKPKKFEPIKPDETHKLKRSVSLPENVTPATAAARREGFRRRTVSCKPRLNYGGGDHAIVENLAEEEEEEEGQTSTVVRVSTEPRLQETTARPADPVLPEPTKPRLGKKQRVALKVMHSFGWVLCCPVYTMVACVRESPDPDDEEDLHDDVCLPCYT